MFLLRPVKTINGRLGITLQEMAQGKGNEARGIFVGPGCKGIDFIFHRSVLVRVYVNGY